MVRKRGYWIHPDGKKRYFSYYDKSLQNPGVMRQLRKLHAVLEDGTRLGEVLPRRWSRTLWPMPKMRAAVPYGSPGNIEQKGPTTLWQMPFGSFLPKAMQNLRLRYSSYLGEAKKPLEAMREYIRQGSILRTPEPQLLGILPGRRKKSLIKAKPITLKRRWFAKRYKGVTHQVVDSIPLKEIPEGWKMRNEPKYVKDIEVIAFAEAPIGTFLNKGEYDGRGRNENGFLQNKSF